MARPRPWLILPSLLLALYGGWAYARSTGAALVPNHPTALTVTAYGPAYFGTSLPPPRATIRVRNRAKISRLVSDLNSLQRAPRGVSFSCPADTLVHDALTFTYPGGRLLTVKVETSGCRFVTAHGVVAFSSPRLLRDLDTLPLFPQ